MLSFSLARGKSLPSASIFRTRPFSVSQHPALEGACRACNRPLPSWHVVCAACGAVQRVDATAVNLFKLLDVPQQFAVDAALLEQKYKAAQKLVHPDKFGRGDPADIELATTASAALNVAYEKLGHAPTRARVGRPSGVEH